jgi:predicted Zn-dependent protease
VDTSTRPAEIRYTTASKYTDAVNNAINRWNELPGGVVIARDTASTVNDLEITDLRSNDTWHGRWVWNPGADNINFNTRILDGSTWTSTERRKTALHEFGHAHGFGHNDLAWPQSIMRQGKRAQGTLGTHDVSDYSRWQ